MKRLLRDQFFTKELKDKNYCCFGSGDGGDTRRGCDGLGDEG